MTFQATEKQKELLRAAVAADSPLPAPIGSNRRRMYRAMVEADLIDANGFPTLAGRIAASTAMSRRSYRRLKRSTLPGGGPWLIEDSCPSGVHNTEAAARGYRYAWTEVGPRTERGYPQCICPRAIDRLAASRARSAAHQAAYVERAKLNPPKLPTWWTGPWLIAAGCPAEGHHNASRARKEGCICPRAKALQQEARRADEVRARAKRAKIRAARRDVPLIRSIPPKQVTLFRAPDMSRAACALPGAGPVFDAAMEHPGRGPGHKGVRGKAKFICETRCPVRDACRGWALQEEKPAGSWGGVWGGLDIWERREIEHAAAQGK